MKMSEDHNQSICSSCFYSSVIEKPSLRRIIAESSRIDKLYLGKFIPLRERKIVTSRAQYDHLGNEEFQREASLKPRSAKVLASSKNERIQHTHENKDTDSNSVVLGLVTIKNKGETLQSSNSINICSCCSCNSSIIAREAGTRYTRDYFSGKKMYKISRSRKKKESRTIRSPKAKLIRSEPTTKSTLSSSEDRAIKVKSSTCPLYSRQYLYSYATMGEGNLQTVGAKNTTKPSLITKSLITSGGDKLHTKKSEVEAHESKSFSIENKRATIRTLKDCFCTLKLLKNVKTKPRIKCAPKDLPETECDFPKSTKLKKTTRLKPKLIQPIKLTTASKLQHKNKKTNSKESIISHCSVKRNINPDCSKKHLLLNKTYITPKKGTSKFNSCIDTYYMGNIMRSKTLNYPKRETIFSGTNHVNTISENSSQTSKRLGSFVQFPDVSQNSTIKNKHTTEPQCPIQKVTQPKGNRYSNLENVRIISSPRENNFLLEQKSSGNNTVMDRQKKASILALHNIYGNSCLDQKRRKFLKSTINRCFCKLVQYGKDKKNKHKLATDSIAQAYCEITSSVKSDKQQYKVTKPKYKDLLKHLGNYKRRERSLNITTSSMPESISSMSCHSSIDSIIGTKVHRVKRRRIQHEKSRIVKREGKEPFWQPTSSLCFMCSRQDTDNSSILTLKNKFYSMSKESQSSIVQYEWKPTIPVNKFQTNIMKKSKNSEAVNLKRYSCRLFKAKGGNKPHLYIVNTAEAGNIKNPMLSPPMDLSQSQSLKDLQYFEQFSSNSQSLGLFSHGNNSTWQSMSLRDPFKKYAPVRTQCSDSYTNTVSYCACLGQHTSRRLLTKSTMNNFTNKESGIETDLRSTMLSYQHLQQFCVMNLNIVDPKIKQANFLHRLVDNQKAFDCQQVCVESECDQLKCFNLIHKRLNSQTTIMTSTPVVKQKCIQHICRPQMNINTLPPPSQAKEKCNYCDKSRVQTYALKLEPKQEKPEPKQRKPEPKQGKPERKQRKPEPKQGKPETKQGKQKNTQANKQKKDPKKITNPSGKTPLHSPVTCMNKGYICPKGPKEKCSGASDQKRESSKVTRAINPNRNIVIATETQTKKKDGLNFVQNTTDQATFWHGSEHTHPNSSLKQRREKPMKKKNIHTGSASTINYNYNYPPSVTGSVQNKAVSNTCPSRPRKNHNSFTTVTISGLITVCKKNRGIVVTQNSTCSFQPPSTRKQKSYKKVAAATGTTRKKYVQKGTDPLYGDHDLECKCQCARNQKVVMSKPYPRNVKLVDYAPADGRNTTVGHYGTDLRRPEKNKEPPTAFQKGAVHRKSKPYEYGGVGTKRERGVGTLRSQTNSGSSSTEPYRARNVRFTKKLPKKSIGRKSKKQPERGASSHCFGTKFSTNIIDEQKSFKKRAAQKRGSTSSATALKRCFCTTSLKKSANQKVYYMPVTTRPNNIIDYQRGRSLVSSLHKSEFEVKQTNYKLPHAPYEFLPIECDPGDFIERVIKKKQYKKINLPIENIDIINSAKFNIGTCTQLLTPNIDILTPDKNNKALTRKKSYIRSSKSTEDSSFENISKVKSSTDLQSDTASYMTHMSTTDSMGVMCNTGNLTGMTPHLNKHLYALRLETSPKTANVGVDSKKGEVKIVMGSTGTKNYRSQTRIGPLECKASDCAIGSCNPKMCEKKIKPKRLAPGECHPDDCAVGNYNPKKCEKKILARTLSPTECDPIDCALNNFNPKKCEKTIKTRTQSPGECNSGECLFGNTNLKKIEKKTQVKSNRRQPTVSRQHTEKSEPHSEKVERKTRQLSHVVEERRFKSLKYPFDAGIAITSSISLDVEFYRQERCPKLPCPCPPKDKIVRKTQKVSIQPRPKPTKPRAPCRVKCQKSKHVSYSRLVSSSSSQSVCIQAKPQQKQNVIRKCFCNIMRLGSTKDKKIGAKQMDATCADVGVVTKDKYLEPEFFCPYEVCKKQKRGTRTFCCGTAISKRSYSTMTDKRTKNERSDVKGILTYKPCQECSGTMTQKIKPHKYDQYEVCERPCEPCQGEKRKLPRICYSDFNITSNVSFDVEISKYETGVRSGSSSRSVPKSSTPYLASATPKDKTPSRKTATTKLPSKSSSETVLKSRNRGQSYVHPSLKRCFCTMKLQKPPYTHEQIVNFMTSTVTPLNNLKRRLIVQDKSSNVCSSSTYIIHDTIGRISNDSPRRYSKSRIFNEFLNKFENVVLSKLFRKSLEIKPALTKDKIMQAADPFRGKRCLYDSNQMAVSNEMRTIYPYDSYKFHNYTSCTMIHKGKRSRFHRHSRKHYDLITKKRRHKRQCIAEKVQEDFNKRPIKKNHFLNKLKNTLHSIFMVFYRNKHRDACNRGNNKPKKHSDLIKKKKEQIVTTKLDILKTSKSDRQECHVVNNVDPLKTSKSDRQPANPKMIINQQKSKRVKVGSPRVSINDKNNTRHSKCMEQGRKIYSRFQSGDIEIRQNHRKDYLPKCYKHYLNNYQCLKCTAYKPNVLKQRIQLALNHGKKKKRKEKYESPCCKNLEWVADKRLHDIRKMKIYKSKNFKGKFAKERRKNKGGEEKRRQTHKRLLRKSIKDPLYFLNVDPVTRLY